ncbi:MAG: arginine--tRNA ligase [Bacteroidota bacterium]
MTDYLAQQIRAALATYPSAPDGFDAAALDPEFQTPNNPEHGDLASNVALKLAKPLRSNPRQIAQHLADALNESADPKRIAAVEVAGPGFLNFRFSTAYLYDGVAEILAQGNAYGRAERNGQTALVEYVSANPTGPLTVGHGRNAVLGDTIANLLDWTGYDVTREYYFNDAGRQMRVLAQSVMARYEALVNPDVPTKTLEGGLVVPESFPDDGYQGDYIQTIAEAVRAEHGDDVLGRNDAQTLFKDAATAAIFGDIEQTMRRIGIPVGDDPQGRAPMQYFNEHSLYASNAVWDAVEELRAKDLAYDKDGAVWFKTGELGKVVTNKDGEEEAKDTVLVKSSGEPTYRLPDIAYHLDKLNRGFDKAVDIFGADHIATYPDVVRGVEALGGDASKIEVLVYQFVTLVRDGQEVKMSTRKATYVTLDELMDEINEAICEKAASEEVDIELTDSAGPDVVRFYFQMLSPNTHLNFDLNEATEASFKNPVFYLQYAHARIRSIQRKAEDQGLAFDPESVDWSALTHPSEVSLMKVLPKFADAISDATKSMGPHRLVTYLREVATEYSRFNNDCFILREPEEVALPRLALSEAARQVLNNGLTILGISAPERM